MLSVDAEVLAGGFAARPSPQTSQHTEDLAPPAPSPLPFKLPEATRRPIVLTGDDAGRQIVHAIRQETGLTLREIAERLGVSRKSVETYQYRPRNPSVKWLGRIVTAVGGRVVIEFPPLS